MSMINRENLSARAIKLTETAIHTPPENTGSVVVEFCGVPVESGTDAGHSALWNTGTPGTPQNNRSCTDELDTSPIGNGPLPAVEFSVQSGVPGVSSASENEKVIPFNRIEDAGEDTPSAAPRVPDVVGEHISFGPYASSPDGIFYVSEDASAQRVRLCSELQIMAMTRDADRSHWGLLVQLRDQDGHAHEMNLSREAIGKGSGEEVLALLMSRGATVSTKRANKANLIEYLAQVRVPARRVTVPHCGWHGGDYVTPGTVYTKAESSELVFMAQHLAVRAYAKKGTLKGWKQKLGRLAVGNSRLMLAYGTAFAAPLLRVLNIDGGGFHLRGASSTGKTTLIRAAASIYSDQSFSQTWRATSNGLESVAQARNDALLTLDELSQVDPKEAGAVAYMLANGEGRTRANRDGTARPPVRFRLMFLSTGEVSLADRVSEDKFSRGRIMAGQEIRLLDVPADTGANGAYENLHGFKTGAELSNHIRDATEQEHGTAFAAFMTAIVTRDAGWSETVKERVATRAKEFLRNRADGQLLRSAERFAVVSVAAELASEFEVGPWTVDNARDGVRSAFEAWVTARGGPGSSESKQALRNVQHFIQMHGNSRFDNAAVPDLVQKTSNRAGYRLLDGDKDIYAFTPAGWREALAGLDAKTAAVDLAKAGYLLGPDAAGKYSVSKKVHGQKMRLYLIDASVLDEED